MVGWWGGSLAVRKAGSKGPCSADWWEGGKWVSSWDGLVAAMMVEKFVGYLDSLWAEQTAALSAGEKETREAASMADCSVLFLAIWKVGWKGS
jgi:hypothetical protein